MKTKLLILSICSLLLINCSNNDDNDSQPTLPPITQTGENTFGAYVNGNLLIPRDGTGTIMGPDSGMSFVAGGIPPQITYNEIKVHDYKSGNGGLLDIHIINLHENGEGIFTLNESNCEGNVDAYPTLNIRCRWWDESSQQFKWFCSIEGEGSLSITRYDFDNQIVSGTFYCKAVNSNDASEIIEITEGRFDINWGTLPYTSFN
ncbi:MAG: hypothetical protein KDC81_10585 [Flavobacteriaceae bacterium]|nr:hypothetical protein [Flavobacteriaceae bacterium]